MFDFDKYHHCCAALLDFMKKGRGGIYIGGFNILGANVFGQQLIVDSRHAYSLKRLYVPSPVETSVLALMIQLITKGMTCLDIGAGCGFYSLLASAVSGPHGKIYSFEPIPECFSLLKENKEINDIETIIPLQALVSDEVKMIKRKYFKTNHQFFFSPLSSEEKIMETESLVLDKYFFDKETSIDFVNINFKKDLPAVIKGMEEIIKLNSEIKILCRFNQKKIKETGKDPLSFLNDLESKKLKLLLLPQLNLIEKEELLNYEVTKHVLLTRS